MWNLKISQKTHFFFVIFVKKIKILYFCKKTKLPVLKACFGKITFFDTFFTKSDSYTPCSYQKGVSFSSFLHFWRSSPKSEGPKMVKNTVCEITSDKVRFWKKTLDFPLNARLVLWTLFDRFLKNTIFEGFSRVGYWELKATFRKWRFLKKNRSPLKGHFFWKKFPVFLSSFFFERSWAYLNHHIFTFGKKNGCFGKQCFRSITEEISSVLSKRAYTRLFFSMSPLHKRPYWRDNKKGL